MKHKQLSKDNITIDDLFDINDNVKSSVTRRSWFKDSQLYKDIVEYCKQYSEYRFKLGHQINVYAKRVLPQICPHCGKEYFKFKGYTGLFKVCKCHINYDTESKNKHKHSVKTTKNKLFEQITTDLKNNKQPHYTIKYLKNMEFDDQHFKISFNNYDVGYSIIFYTNSHIPVVDKQYKVTERMYIIKHGITLNDYHQITKTKQFINYKIGFDIENKLSKRKVEILSKIEEQGFEVIDKQSFLKSKMERCTVKCKKCGKILNPLIKCGLWKRIYCEGCYKVVCRSKIEDEIIEFIKSIKPDIKIYTNYKQAMISTKEIDIYLPEYHLGIEVTGLLWHSFGYSYPNTMEVYDMHKYHLYEKLILARHEDIQLLSVYDAEWFNNKSYIKSILKSYLDVYDYIVDINDCIIDVIDNDKLNNFYNENSIPQYNEFNNIGHYGIIYNNNIIGVVSHDISCLNGYYIANNYKVINSALKLFDYIYNKTKIYKYIQNSRFISVQDSMNFLFMEHTLPNIYYTKDCEHIYCEEKSKQLISTYNDNISLMDNMLTHGYRQIVDCGNYIYIHINHAVDYCKQ